MIKKIGIVLLILIVGFAVTLWVISEPRPQGTEGPQADAMARKMLAALNQPAYDSVKVLKWNFKGLHQYVWDKANDRVEVRWDDIKVTLDLSNNSGVVYQNDSPKTDEGEVKMALAYFFNDSFWLVAPYKLFDDGVKRSIVKTEEGEALLVYYTTGGVTPGDAYLWFLDENGFPYKYKMWVSIIPIGGLEFSWEQWQQYEGVWLPGNHKGLIEVEMMDVTAEM